jgi:hypothetical protein
VQPQEWHLKEIHQLKHQIYMLHQHIHKLQNKLNENQNVFEYHLKQLNIDKVKGSLQIGQLIEKDIEDENGIHRFFIEAIQIKEVEGSGTVGVGIMEKGRGKKKLQKKISPEEASEQIKDLFNQIKDLLGLKHVPEFFQKLAVKEKVLTKVWEQMKKEWSTTEPFTRFYEQIKERLERIHISEQHINQDSVPRLPEDLCKELSDQLKKFAKVLLVVIHLIHKELPGYLHSFEYEPINEEKLKIHIHGPNHSEIDKQILKAIKESFNIKEFPSVIKKLEEHPNALKFILDHKLQPAAHSEEIIDYLMDMKTLFISKISEAPTPSSKTLKLSSEEKGFLYSHLIETIETYPKYLVLVYLSHQLCR